MPAPSDRPHEPIYRRLVVRGPSSTPPAHRPLLARCATNDAMPQVHTHAVTGLNLAKAQLGTCVTDRPDDRAIDATSQLQSFTPDACHNTKVAQGNRLCVQG